MSISDVVEQTKEIVEVDKDVCESFDKTKNEDGTNVDSFFSKLLKKKNLWKHMK